MHGFTRVSLRLFLSPACQSSPFPTLHESSILVKSSGCVASVLFLQVLVSSSITDAVSVLVGNKNGSKMLVVYSFTNILTCS